MPVCMCFRECVNALPSLSVSSFLQQRTVTAAGVIHVSVPRTSWLCRIVCSNTGRKQALI